MKVNGFAFREALKRWELRRETAANQFTDSLYRFKDDDKLSPDDAMRAFEQAEQAVSTLQAAQARYNLAVSCMIQGKAISLHEVVKRIGGAGRAEAMWRGFAGAKKKERYSYEREDRTRAATDERAFRTISVPEAMKRAQAAAKYAGSLREAMAMGNTQQIDMELDGGLFD